jgi:hypothetical protein
MPLESMHRGSARLLRSQTWAKVPGESFLKSPRFVSSCSSGIFDGVRRLGEVWTGLAKDSYARVSDRLTEGGCQRSKSTTNDVSRDLAVKQERSRDGTMIRRARHYRASRREHPLRSSAAAIRTMSDDDLDRAGPVSLYSDASLTWQFVLEDHAVRHSYHHSPAYEGP